MNPLALALQYMDIFYSNREIDTLAPLFADDLVFQGPFYQFDSADAYLASLRSDSRAGLTYSLIHSSATATSACLIYQFSKPGTSTPMAQLFEVEEEKIKKIVLIFDTKVFANYE